MAVLVEAISVVVRRDAIRSRYPGGWLAFRQGIPNRTACVDDDLVRVGFMNPQDVGAYVEELERQGLAYFRDDEAVDLVVVDQRQGPMVACRWIESAKVSIDPGWISACWFKGSIPTSVATPEGWRFEGSLSQQHDFYPTGQEQESLRFLRHEEDVDVFLNLLNGKEVYAARPFRKGEPD